MTPKAPKRDFADLNDDEVDSWIAKFVAKGLTNDLQFQLLLEERAKRQSKLLNVDKSLEHLIEVARQKRYTTYGDLAEINGVPWNKARHLMNGPRGHLDRLLEICHVRRMPLLTSLCVNQQGIATGELTQGALDGFISGAQRLGYKISDRTGFLQQCQRECFEWASALPASN